MSLLAVALLALVPATLATDPIPELFSPLVPQKILATANTVQSPAKYPQWTDRVNGTWQFFSPDTWTSGFFPATLYALNERKNLCGADDEEELGKTDWLDLARAWSTAEVPLETKTTVGHDVGFLSFPFIEELKVDYANETAITAVSNFASELAARFNPKVGCTRSWDTSDPTDFQVIIDNMMNLEVLFQSDAIKHNQTLIDIATSHADKTLVNHLRPDGSSFHVVEYNATTGKVIKQRTAQGYADNSTWSRGQAWGLYGFANMFKHTKNITYLETSRKMAQYFLNNLPEDGVVPWDFNAPLTPPRPADSSAATIAASGLLLLSQGELTLTPANVSGSDFYIGRAVQLLANITELAWRPQLEWQALLANGTVNNPAGNNLTGIVYGDYYFVKTANDLFNAQVIKCDGSFTGTTPSSPFPLSSPISNSSSLNSSASGSGSGSGSADGVRSSSGSGGMRGVGVVGVTMAVVVVVVVVGALVGL